MTGEAEALRNYPSFPKLRTETEHILGVKEI